MTAGWIVAVLALVAGVGLGGWFLGVWHERDRAASARMVIERKAQDEAKKKVDAAQGEAVEIVETAQRVGGQVLEAALKQASGEHVVVGGTQ